jgi:hypothetical protein
MHDPVIGTLAFSSTLEKSSATSELAVMQTASSRGQVREKHRGRVPLPDFERVDVNLVLTT